MQIHSQELSALCKADQQSLEKLKEEKDRLQMEKERLDNETMVILPKRRYCIVFSSKLKKYNIFLNV